MKRHTQGGYLSTQKKKKEVFASGGFALQRKHFMAQSLGVIGGKPAVLTSGSEYDLSSVSH